MATAYPAAYAILQKPAADFEAARDDLLKAATAQHTAIGYQKMKTLYSLMQG